MPRRFNEPLRQRGGLYVAVRDENSERDAALALGQVAADIDHKKLASPAAPPAPACDRKLQPSLQAWAASRERPVAPISCNVGASEKGVDDNSQESAPQHFAISSPRNDRSCGSNCDTTADLDQRDWFTSLRQRAEVLSSEKPASKAWQPKLTICVGPVLHTAQRAISRSSSRHKGDVRGGYCTPDSQLSTPRGRRGHSRDREELMHPREIKAAEQHRRRMATARTPSASPLRARQESASPARSVRSASASSRVMSTPRRRANPSPGRSRLSELAQTSVSRCPSSDDLEQARIDEMRHQLKMQMKQNERTWRSASKYPELGILSARCSKATLTVPVGPELHTANRPLRSQSATSSCQAPMASSRGRTCERLRPPPGADSNEWIRQGDNPKERAERARAVARAKFEDTETEKRQRLCVFKVDSAVTDSPARVTRRSQKK